MPRILTAYFGELDYAESSIFRFPQGLPGFEEERDFVFLQRPQTAPLMFLQSLANAQLCFVLLPILVIDPNYLIRLDGEELAALDLPAGQQPRIGEDILCAAIVRAGDSGPEGPTANLLAPVVVNLKAQLGMQVIQVDSPYSHRHPIYPKELTSCL